MNHKIDFLVEAIMEDPSNIELRFRLVAEYINENEYDKAKKQLMVISQQDPNNEKVKEIQKMLENLSSESNGQKKVNETDEKNTLNEHLEKTEFSFKDIGGMDELKENIRLSIVYPFQHPELYEKYKKRIGGGILLYGPPGCGKTHIARATAGELNAMFINMSIEDILDMMMGESERKMHNIFELARNNVPAVIFIDEVDALGANRMKISSQNLSNLVNQFLIEMDGLNSQNDKILIIGATNTPWQVDPALRRPGRFDRIVFVTPPDELSRAEIFKIHLRDKPLSNIDYLELAKKTHLFSGADIARICELTTENVIKEVMKSGKEREITMNDLLMTIDNLNSSVKEWFANAKNFAKYSNESGDYTPILEYMKENKLY